MAAMSFPFSHGDTALPAVNNRQALFSGDLGSAHHAAICESCGQSITVDTDGVGGLAQFDAGTYQRHMHQVLSRRRVS